MCKSCYRSMKAIQRKRAVLESLENEICGKYAATAATHKESAKTLKRLAKASPANRKKPWHALSLLTRNSATTTGKSSPVQMKKTQPRSDNTNGYIKSSRTAWFAISSTVPDSSLPRRKNWLYRSSAMRRKMQSALS